MKSFNRKRSLSPTLEMLEDRRLLSATVLSPIPTQNIGAGQNFAQITLNSFLNDPQLTGGTVIEMETPLGNMFFQLTDSQTPNTVANFKTYINNGEYQPTIIQRSAPTFVLQGGGTKPSGAENNPVQTLSTEAGILNTKGTIAMALTSAGRNSGTNQWFINLANNPFLDGTMDGGPFTVFGNIIDNGMAIANQIAALPIIDGSAENFNWGALPVINYSGPSTASSVPQNNLVTDQIVRVSKANAVAKYSAVSHNTALVTVSIIEGQLVVTPVNNSVSGSTTITASVTDPAGHTASATFNVNVAADKPANLAITQVPTATIVAGRAISPNITVSVTDSAHQPVNGAKVNLQIVSGPGGAVLGGTIQALSVNGVATFNNVTLNVAGTYTLKAVHGGVASAASASFNVRHTTPVMLAFGQPPTPTTAGTAISPPITVDIEDQFGNVAINNDTAVTLAIQPGTGPDGAVLGGTVTVLAQNGVAMFSDITLSEAGAYMLKAKDGTLTKVRSASFNIG